MRSAELTHRPGTQTTRISAYGVSTAVSELDQQDHAIHITRHPRLQKFGNKAQESAIRAHAEIDPRKYHNYWPPANIKKTRRRTIITSSPTTSTSGLLKCLRAAIPAKHAQSSIFPSSDRKCSVSFICQTYSPHRKIIVSVSYIGRSVNQPAEEKSGGTGEE